MHPRLRLLSLLLVLPCGLPATTKAQAQPAAAPAPREGAPAPLAKLTARDALVLGVVEGVTEFLPVSSTGHLILTNQLLGLDSEAPLHDAQGQPLWHKRPSPELPAGEPLTLKLAADTYTVVIQVGAILAVLSLYWARCIAMLRGALGRDRDGRLLLRNLVCAFVPVAIVGLVVSDLVEAYLFSTPTVLLGLVGGALLMLWVERWRRTKDALAALAPNAALAADSPDASSRGHSAPPPASGQDKLPAQLSVAEALKIGCVQCLALWPGASRSMLTIVGGYWAGLSPARAAEFSFLVGLPVLGGAATLKAWRSGPEMIEVFGWSSVLLGMTVAAASAALAVRFFVSFLSRHGLGGFALYRLLLAAAIATALYM